MITIVEYIRVSAGTAAVLGLNGMKFDALPTTAYLMMTHAGKCSANCSFCPQSRTTKGKASQLSRITWPEYPLAEVATRLTRAVADHKLFRACIQTLNYPALMPELVEVVQSLRRAGPVPISVAIHALAPEDLQSLKNAGVNRVGIALDGCTPYLFNPIKGSQVKGPYRWEDTLSSIQQALEIFGAGNVSTHFIVGLGESERDLLAAIQDMQSLGVTPSLFAFTPVKGTQEETRPQPPIVHYRKMQLGRELIVNRQRPIGMIRFSPAGEVVSFNLTDHEFQEIIDAGSAFQTRGCPHCNRPFYDSRPGGTIYNYAVPLAGLEKEEIRRTLAPFR